MNLTDFVYRLFVQQTRNISITSLLCMILIGVYVFFLFVFFWNKKSEKRITGYNQVVITLLIIYVCFLLQITIFSRAEGSRSSIHNSYEFHFSLKKMWMILKYMIVPSYSEIYQGGWFSAQQLVYDMFNVMLFIPYGILLALLQKNVFWVKRILMSVCYFFLSTLAIECAQWKLGRGYFEIRDIILNVAGGFLGCIAVQIILGMIALTKYVRDRKEKSL